MFKWVEKEEKEKGVESRGKRDSKIKKNGRKTIEAKFYKERRKEVIKRRERNGEKLRYI